MPSSTDVGIARIVDDAKAIAEKMMHGDENGEDELTGAEFLRLQGILDLDIPLLAAVAQAAQVTYEAASDGGKPYCLPDLQEALARLR